MAGLLSVPARDGTIARPVRAPSFRAPFAAVQNPRPASVILVGFMGAGKSAVGRRLARRLGLPFLDTDAWIVRNAGKSIPRIFMEEGEPAFRDLETSAAAAIAGGPARVVATGGGILGRDENLRLLRRAGVLICLHASPEEILARTAPWENRPMLRTAPDPRQAVERLLAERAPRYALADWCLDTTGLRPDEVVERLCERLPSLYPIAATRS